MRWSSGETKSEFGFTSQRQEKGLGLYDYHARMYSPVLGRFISPDSIVPEPANPQSFNRYSYVYNNPTKYTDPSGHCVWDGCIVEGAIIGAGFVLAVDYSYQVYNNMSDGMSFWDAGYYENVDTQELGGAMLTGTALGGGGAAGSAALEPAIARATISCLTNRICAAILTGGGGKVGKTANKTTEKGAQILTDPTTSKGHQFVTGLDLNDNAAVDWIVERQQAVFNNQGLINTKTDDYFGMCGDCSNFLADQFKGETLRLDASFWGYSNDEIMYGTITVDGVEVGYWHQIYVENGLVIDVQSNTWGQFLGEFLKRVNFSDPVYR